METTERLLAEIEVLCRINPGLIKEATGRIIGITQSLNRVEILEPTIQMYKTEIERHKQEIQQGKNKKSIEERAGKIRDKCFFSILDEKTGGKRCLTNREFREVRHKVDCIAKQAAIDLL